MNACRTCIVLPDDRFASDIARRITGTEARWRELVGVNPQKKRSRVGGFDFLADGERLVLPVSWPDDPFADRVRMPKSAPAARRFEAGALTVSPPPPLPNGWVDEDLLAVMVAANDLGISDPKNLLYVWASETGVSRQGQLNPKTALYLASGDPWSPFFAGGLNGSLASNVRALGFRSADAWLNAPPRIQIQGIYKQYTNHVRLMGEGFDSRAAKIGTTTAALLYAFNFLPAYALNLKSRTQSLIAAPDSRYFQNCILDTSTSGDVQTPKCGWKKGTITLADLEVLTNPSRWPTGWPVYALATRLDQVRNNPALVASLSPTGSSVWSAFGKMWEDLTGSAPKVDAPRVLANSPRAVAVPGWSAKDYWAATGAVLFAGFVIAYSQGWIRR